MTTSDKFQRHSFKVAFKLTAKSVRSHILTFGIFENRIAGLGSCEDSIIGAGAGAEAAEQFYLEPEPEPEPECCPGTGARAGVDQKCHGSASLLGSLDSLGSLLAHCWLTWLTICSFLAHYLLILGSLFAHSWLTHGSLDSLGSFGSHGSHGSHGLLCSFLAHWLMWLTCLTHSSLDSPLAQRASSLAPLRGPPPSPWHRWPLSPGTKALLSAMVSHVSHVSQVNQD